MDDGTAIPPNGAFRAVHGIRVADISDGMSNTLLVGEKHIPPFAVGMPPFDCGIFDGHNPACATRGAGPDFPLAATLTDPVWSFGSYHPFICQFVFCDGSVRALNNSIDPAVLGLLSQRNDGQGIPAY